MVPEEARIGAEQHYVRANLAHVERDQRLIARDVTGSHAADARHGTHEERTERYDDEPHPSGGSPDAPRPLVERGREPRRGVHSCPSTPSRRD